MNILRAIRRASGSVYGHAFNTTMLGIFWITQLKKIDAGYPPEWGWIIFGSLLSIWDLYEWNQRLQGKHRKVE